MAEDDSNNTVSPDTPGHTFILSGEFDTTTDPAILFYKASGLVNEALLSFVDAHHCTGDWDRAYDKAGQARRSIVELGKALQKLKAG